MNYGRYSVPYKDFKTKTPNFRIIREDEVQRSRTRQEIQASTTVWLFLGKKSMPKSRNKTIFKDETTIIQATTT